MSRVTPEAEGQDTESLVRLRTAELARQNEALRGELARLREESVALMLRLQAAETDSKVDREVRRAALNLMEDAVRAREAEQRENIERRRIEGELREANRRKDEFLAILAHELRNPLAPIRNGFDILRMGGLDAEAIGSLQTMIKRQLDHLVRLVDDLMEVSRITRGRIELRLEPTPLSGVVASAIETSRPFIEAAAHELVVELPNEPLVIQGDPIRLVQVFSNLLNNAAKYTNSQGRIELRAERRGMQAVLRIRDNGIGIPPEMLSRVFDLFTQVSSDDERIRGGLGIGLTLVRSLVELHGGSIEAHSEGRGRGSEFVVYLPLAAPTQDALGGAGCGEQESPIGARILVVDDNRDAADSMRMLLNHFGADVHVVYDGQSALEALAPFKPQVMLLDIGMPGMNGLEVARRVRRSPQGDAVTLIALTGWGQEEDRRNSHEAGFDHHLVKPVDAVGLRRLLASLRRRDRSASA